MYMRGVYANVPRRHWHEPSRKERMMFFELRQYRTRPGQREKWVKFMEEEIIPFQVVKGSMVDQT
jgi:hypothetical protein